MINNKLAAVVVTFYPGVERLKRQLDVLKTEVEEIIIVDNGSSPEMDSILESQPKGVLISILRLGSNFGIGYAQNRGIELARTHGHCKILFLDQDSIPVSVMTEALDGALENLLRDGVQVGAVAPVRDDQNNESQTYFLRFDKFPPSELRCGPIVRQFKQISLFLPECWFLYQIFKSLDQWRRDYLLIKLKRNGVSGRARRGIASLAYATPA